MLAQMWKELRWEAKRRLQHWSTCWTTEAEEVRICSGLVTGIGGDEEKEGWSDVSPDHRHQNEVWRKWRVLAGKYLQAYT